MHRYKPKTLFGSDRAQGILCLMSVAGAMLMCVVPSESARPRPSAETHWSFQPLSNPQPPVLESSGVVNPIDAFVRARLREKGLEPAPEADRVTLIRRLYLDVTGLPPSPEQIQHFVDSRDPEAWGKLVDELLGNPRHGERWAQHWLDVVRYADTHGFEVNTPRPNAWPYRDYVIRAFNEDKPYDEFVFEQLAGDTVGEDAATGFLVAAPVLLPGQIGKDEASKRLARQDALDEMVIGAGETFLGLTLGCARCHDHKFDPISQEDYYSMQAFFAGVEYGDRTLRTPEYLRRLAEAERLRPRLAKLEEQVRALDSPAFTGRTLLIDDEDPDRVALLAEKRGHGVHPKGAQRGCRADPGDADRLPNLGRGRYTWWTNEPGKDVFTWNPGAEGRFQIWLSWGTHGGGAHTRDARYLLDRDGDPQTRDDQQEIARIDQGHFANVDQGETGKKPLWSGFLDAGVHALRKESRIVLRGGETGAAISADAILLQENNGSPARLPRLREPVNPLETVEKFAPTRAKFIRFTTLATIDNNRRQPCIDELEVFTAGRNPRNVALAGLGTRATSSGNLSNSGRHRLGHINDGNYGNEKSWISDEKGGGWVQLELKEPALIDRILWARDRKGKYQDRLPVSYRIEVAFEAGQWKTVASSEDRAPLETPTDSALFRLRNLQGSDAGKARALIAERRDLRSRIEKLEEPELVYGGTFREPDAIYVLARGDPEQRKARIGPAAPHALSQVALPMDAPGTQRRVALAKWIASADNPLTARVMVNRIWQYHFGNGLVETPSDFGLNGAQPSHPELLDWLAGEFIRGGWSMKNIHKLILTSRTYRQSNRIDPDAQKADGDCRLLWRFPSRRLEAEAIRDSMLAVSGRLNLSMGGPGFSFFKTRGGLSGFPPLESHTPEEWRRMIYSHKIRMERVPVFGAFDCPDAGQPMPKRSESTTAIQALNLFNSPFVAEQADAFARRIGNAAGGDPGQQVRRAYELALGRQPHDAELKAALEAIRQHGLETLCRVLFNSNEFLFLP